MKPRSPTIEGFRVMFSMPSLGLAEIAWRWSFGFAAVLVFAFAFFEYLDTLRVGAGDIFLLRTRHPILISRAIAHIFQGSGFRAGKTLLLVLLVMSAAWIVTASWGRAMTVRSLIHYYREEKQSVSVGQAAIGLPFGLHALRVIVSAAAAFSLVGAFVLAATASSSRDPSPGSTMLIFFAAAMAIYVAWSILNWVFSLAAIFAVSEGQSTLASISRAANLCCDRGGSVAAAGTWFGLAHLVIFFIASSLVVFPLGFAGILPAGVILGGIVVVTLLYFAAADVLYAGRMAAYVAMILPQELFMPDAPAPLLDPATDTGVDRGEVILSDVQPLGRSIPQPGIA